MNCVYEHTVCLSCNLHCRLHCWGLGININLRDA